MVQIVLALGVAFALGAVVGRFFWRSAAPGTGRRLARRGAGTETDASGRL
jgi:hypothetical protein